MSLIRDTYLRFQVLVHEVTKFGVVGAAGFVVQFGVQNALYKGPGSLIGPTTSVVIASVFATMVTFLGNRYWAFRHRKGGGLRQETVLFIVFNVIGMLIQAGIVALVTDGLGMTGRIPYNAATIVGIGLATLFRLYCYRKFVFSGKHQPPDSPAEPKRTPARTSR